MQLYFIRHAQSENNKLWADMGHDKGRVSDPLLTEVGHQQAQLVAAYLAAGDYNVEPENDLHNRQGLPITRLYSSLMQRAVLTGRYIAEQLDLPLHGLEVIHEMGGIWERHLETEEQVGLPGPDRPFFEEHYPFLVLPETLGEEGWWAGRADEEWVAVVARAEAFLEYLLTAYGDTDEAIAIVSHAGFYQALLQVLLGYQNPNRHLDRERWVGFRIYNTSISRIHFDESRLGVIYLNRVEHLPAHLLT